MRTGAHRTLRDLFHLRRSSEPSRSDSTEFRHAASRHATSPVSLRRAGVPKAYGTRADPPRDDGPQTLHCVQAARRAPRPGVRRIATISGNCGALVSMCSARHVQLRDRRRSRRSQSDTRYHRVRRGAPAWTRARPDAPSSWTNDVDCSPRRWSPPPDTDLAGIRRCTRPQRAARIR